MSLQAKRNTGFTLLEVLIAIVITAFIGLGSWQLLGSAIKASDRTQVRLQQLAQLQKTMLFMARDFQQIIPRSIRNEYGDYQAAVSTESDFYMLEFTRVGWRNPLRDKRSEVQRVAYELDQEGSVLRHYWRVLDRSQDSTTRYKTLLEDVASLSFQYMNEGGAWLDEWPPIDTSSTAKPDPHFKVNQLPKAIRVVLEHSYFGEITRLYDLPTYLENIDSATNGSGGNPNGNPNGSSNNSGGDSSVGGGSDAAGTPGGDS